jgi:hypothetical protein
VQSFFPSPLGRRMRGRVVTRRKPSPFPSPSGRGKSFIRRASEPQTSNKVFSLKQVAFQDRINQIQPSRQWVNRLSTAQRYNRRERRRLDLVVEAFNLFNHSNVLALNPFFGSGARPFRRFARLRHLSHLGKSAFRLTLSFN